MTDKIKTTITLGNITMRSDDGGLIAISHDGSGDGLKTYRYDFDETPLTESKFDRPFHIECTDDPSKLHKFCEMKYLGLVDNPHYKKVGDLIREMIKKFDGCLVYIDDSGSDLITKKHLIRLGCSRGVREVFGHTFTEIRSPSGAGIVGISFNRIDASKPEPLPWVWPSSYDKDIRAMCDQLKDVEP